MKIVNSHSFGSKDKKMQERLKGFPSDNRGY